MTSVSSYNGALQIYRVVL